MADYTKINFTRMGGVYGVDNHTRIQNLINNNPSKRIIIGESASDLVYISKPLIAIANTVLTINATVKLTDGVVRPLTQDAATGQNRVYVDNSDGVYRVGQNLSVGATNYPTGGGGAVSRKMAQSGKVITATLTYVEFEYNLRTTISGISVGDLLVSNGATVGHAQTMIYCRDIDNVFIDGVGMLDGNFDTMHNTYHPCAMGGNTSAVPGFEDSMGGNGVVFWGCNNVKTKGISELDRLELQEFNIGSILHVDGTGFNFNNIRSTRPYMKHLAFSLGSDNGSCINAEFDTSVNEDGLSLHDAVTNSVFRNIQINDCPRIGLGVGSASHNNIFENITIDFCNLSLYTYISSGDFDVHDNEFTDITITRGVAGIIFGGVQDTTLTNVNISFGRAGNHCITIGGQCENIVFNGGGCYDTNLISSNSGWGFRMAAKEAYHDYESFDIVVNNFEFKRLNRGIVDLGSGLATFDTCVLDDNDLNGDLSSPDFTFINCTVDGLPYP